MKILFNCTTNVVGGGVKNSALFIKYAKEYTEIEWFFAVSEQVKEILDNWGIQQENIYLFNKSPARDKNSRRRLRLLAFEHKANLVYTMAGPSYVDFNITHVMGISNAFITHADFQSYGLGRNFAQTFGFVLKCIYQCYFSRKADCWIFQTETARTSFSKRLFVNIKKCTVVSNAIGNEFVDFYKKKPIHIVNCKKQINIFCPAADYSHKALHLVPAIAKEMKSLIKDRYDFKFIFTLKKNSKIWQQIKGDSKINDVKKNIETIGTYNYTEALSLFDKADMIFVPSILETFSASYLEAFASKRVLIAADRGFARDLCGDAAIYIDPFKPTETSRVIDRLICNEDKQNFLIRKGQLCLEKYGTQADRVGKIIDVLKRKLKAS